MPAVFAVKSVVRGRPQLNQAENLGPGGMTLRRLPDHPVGPGTAITLTFALPGGPALLRAAGVVVTDTLAGSFRRTGVRFTSLAPDVAPRIERFCADELEAQSSDESARMSSLG